MSVTRSPHEDENEDLFSPRPTVFEGGFAYTPIVHYFTVENQPAKEEFESKVIQPL